MGLVSTETTMACWGIQHGEGKWKKQWRCEVEVEPEGEAGVSP